MANPDPHTDIHAAATAGSVRVAILSDTHGYLDPRIAETVAEAGADFGVHAGDIMGTHILESLAGRVGQLVAVAGNNDQPGIWADGAEDVVATLPRTAALHLPGGILAVEHGHFHGHRTPDHDSLRQAHPQARLIVYGHTHRLCQDDEAGPGIINPGAAGRTRTHDGPSCLILDAAVDGWRLETRQFEKAAASA